MGDAAIGRDGMNKWASIARQLFCNVPNHSSLFFAFMASTPELPEDRDHATERTEDARYD